MILVTVIFFNDPYVVHSGFLRSLSDTDTGPPHTIRHSYTECYSAGLRGRTRQRYTHVNTRTNVRVQFSSSKHMLKIVFTSLNHVSETSCFYIFPINLWCANRWAHWAEVWWAAREQHREDVDCGYLPKHTHTQSTLTRTCSQNPQD